LVGESEGQRPLGSYRPSRNEQITLKRILWKEDLKSHTGFIWLSTGKNWLALANTVINFR
jgi:hypothetical protein